MGRTAGSKNQVTKTKRQIQETMKTKPKRTRIVKPKAIITLPYNFRIVFDWSSYKLERLLEKGETKAEELPDVEDEDVEVIDTTPDEDKWTFCGYYSKTGHGMMMALDGACHNLLDRKHAGKTTMLSKYIKELRLMQDEFKAIVKEAMDIK